MRTQTTGSTHDSTSKHKVLQMTDDDDDCTATIMRNDNQKWGNHGEVRLVCFPGKTEMTICLPKTGHPLMTDQRNNFT